MRTPHSSCLAGQANRWGLKEHFGPDLSRISRYQTICKGGSTMGFDIKTTKAACRSFPQLVFIGAGILACNQPSSYDPAVGDGRNTAWPTPTAEQVLTPGWIHACDHRASHSGRRRAEPISSFLRNGRNIQSTSVIRRACDPLCSRIAASERDRFVQSRPVAVERQVVPSGTGVCRRRNGPGKRKS